MFFDVFQSLCKQKGISCKQAAEDIGLSNSITTKWKKTGATPGGNTLSKIASYFNVTTDYLLGSEIVRNTSTLAIIKRIELRLAEVGMSKTEFYKRSGISSASYSQWNTGLYTPSERKLKNAAECLGISFEYLLGRTDNLIGHASGSPGMKDASCSHAEAVRSFTGKFKMLDSVDKAKAEAYLDGLLSADKYHDEAQAEISDTIQDG